MQVKHGRLPQAGAVTPFMFGMVQRLIALGEQFAWLFVNHWIHYGDADTQGQTPQRAAWVLDIQAGNRRMDACGDLLGTLLMGVGEDDGEPGYTMLGRLFAYGYMRGLMQATEAIG